MNWISYRQRHCFSRRSMFQYITFLFTSRACVFNEKQIIVDIPWKMQLKEMNEWNLRLTVNFLKKQISCVLFVVERCGMNWTKALCSCRPLNSNTEAPPDGSGRSLAVCVPRTSWLPSNSRDSVTAELPRASQLIEDPGNNAAPLSIEIWKTDVEHRDVPLRSLMTHRPTNWPVDVADGSSRDL